LVAPAVSAGHGVGRSGHRIRIGGCPSIGWGSTGWGSTVWFAGSGTRRWGRWVVCGAGTGRAEFSGYGLRAPWCIHGFLTQRSPDPELPTSPTTSHCSSRRRLLGQHVRISYSYSESVPCRRLGPHQHQPRHHGRSQRGCPPGRQRPARHHRLDRSPLQVYEAYSVRPNWSPSSRLIVSVTVSNNQTSFGTTGNPYRRSPRQAEDLSACTAKVN
jgi:hypothetical protein